MLPARYDGGEYREARDLDQVHIVLGFPSVGYRDRDYYPALLLSTLLGGGMSSRTFWRKLRRTGIAAASAARPARWVGLFRTPSESGNWSETRRAPPSVR